MCDFNDNYTVFESLANYVGCNIIINCGVTSMYPYVCMERMCASVCAFFFSAQFEYNVAI